jgi:hypothetical protein
LRLDVPVELPAGAVELVLVVGSTPQPNGSKYNFADVVGKLQYALVKPGGLAEQTAEPRGARIRSANVDRRGPAAPLLIAEHPIVILIPLLFLPPNVFDFHGD